MLDACLLGTGGMMPLPYRWLTSLLLRYNGSSVLIDCGEGTQIALKKSGFTANPIDVICFTHYHADHISGLPGILLTMGNEDRTEPLLLIGPKGLQRVADALRVISPELPFEVQYREISGSEETFEINGYKITAFKVNHNVLCYGYTIDIERKGLFDVERAKALPIPINCWNKLQHGETVEVEGITYTPDMVMGPDRQGIRLTYCTDTRPTESIVTHAQYSDLFICEGMYSSDDNLDKAKSKKHMLFSEAATLAAKAEVKELWLTHFSPSLTKQDMEIEPVREIFANAYLGKDGKLKEMNFPED